MEIFTNWIFWVVIATVIFVFAIIGFLTDKKKKKVNDGEIAKAEPTELPEVKNTDNVVSDAPVSEPASNLIVNTGLEVPEDAAAENPAPSISFTLDNGEGTMATASENTVSQDAGTNESTFVMDDSSVDRNQVNVVTADMNAENPDENVNSVPTEQANVSQDTEDVSVNIVPNAGADVSQSAGTVPLDSPATQASTDENIWN